MDQDLRDLISKQWHYTMEVEPGVFTNGRLQPAMGTQRQMLGEIGVEGQRCLEFGTMEGLMSLLMAKRGAARVTSHDRFNMPNRIELMQKLHGVSLDYHGGTSMTDFVAWARESGTAPVDVLVFGGILYHFFDPVSGLGRARGLLRDGGIMLIETSAVLDTDLVFHFGAKGEFYNSTDYHHPSVTLLDYLLRFFRLRPLDLSYFFQTKSRDGTKDLYRLCVACRAEDHWLPEPDDAWMGMDRQRFDFAEVVDWDALTSDLPEVPYLQACAAVPCYREDGKTLDLMATLRANAPFDAPEESFKLLLADRA
ncbi:MAG: methyltransferase domain-containing protein [Magnetospiraceae bacterium]